MPVNISRLRYWFALSAIAAVLIVAGFYIYGRMRAARALNEVPKKLGVEVQQSTEGFSLSKSEGGRTLFTVRAAKAVQYKEGRAELRDVSIVMYGRQSDRFDQIYGSDFSYDPLSGDVVSRGEVQIDLQGNTTSGTRPDQVPPQQLRNPIHLKTSGLVFNQKTGIAKTAERIEFSFPQANGSAVGASYDSKNNVLLLDSDVHINTIGSAASRITAQRGALTRLPRQAILYGAHMERAGGAMDAGQVTVFLRDDNSAERALASGGLHISSRGASLVQVRAPEGELRMTGHTNDLQSAQLWGGVQMESSGGSNMSGSAASVFLDFKAKNKLSKVRAQGQVRLLQSGRRMETARKAPQSTPAASPAPASQQFELAADTVDFYMTPAGSTVQRAETTGAAQLTIGSAGPAGIPVGIAADSHTVITARKFYARFSHNHLESLRGIPDAKVVSSSPGQPDKITSSQSLDVKFGADGAISKIVQQHDFQYREVQPGGASERAAWADMATYTPANDQLLLNGSPRIVDRGLTTTARSLRLNRRTGDATAEGDVKSTYSDLKPQPGGALLASSDPVHVTARSVTAQRATGTAHYSGNARLWQGANIVHAPTIDFDRNQRTISAQSNSQKVHVVLVQQLRTGKQNPLNITADRLTYSDRERVARFEGGVFIRGMDATATASQAEVFLKPVTSAGAVLSSAAQVDRVLAEKNVVIEQPNRRATGQKLVYTAAEDKFVLTGGSPSIFDAERGTITGASLTFWNGNDRVLVEGGSSRAVTRTRVSK
ncbi:MAG: LptA/OstA family protein [Terriglobales bacterium]